MRALVLAVALVLAPSSALGQMMGWFGAPPAGGGGGSVSIESGFPVTTFGSASTTTVVSPSFTTAGASLLVAMFHAYNDNGVYTAPTVSGGGLTWTRAVGSGTGWDVDVEIWYAPSTGALGSTTVTVDWSGTGSSSMRRITVLSLLGTAASPVGTTIARTVGGTNLSVTLTGTTSGALLFAVGYNTTNWDQTYTEGSGTTIMSQSGNPNAYGETVRSTSTSAGGDVTLSTNGAAAGSTVHTAAEFKP